MEPPSIRVDDWSDDPPTAIKYMHGDNELEFAVVYPKVKNLCDHEGRGRLIISTNEDSGQLSAIPSGGLRLLPCNDEFLKSFWECAAHLLDYFADFYAEDTPDMQDMWCHLLDVLQEVSELPHTFWCKGLPSCTHAEEFGKQFKEVLDLIDQVVEPRPEHPGQEAVLGDHDYHHRIVHPGTGLQGPPTVRLGGYKAGVKSWAQFLFNGSPGFNVDSHEKHYENKVEPHFEVGARWEVPMGAMAIVQRHTERIRDIAEQQMRRTLVDESGETGLQAERQVEQMLDEYDQNSIKVDRPTAYPSIRGQQMLVQPMRPARSVASAPNRYVGFADPSLLEGDPSLNFVDEAAGTLLGVEPFAHPAGDGPFYMWEVAASRPSAANQSSDPVPDEAYSEMFDEWFTDDIDTEAGLNAFFIDALNNMGKY